MSFLLAAVPVADMKPRRPAIPARYTLTTIPTPVRTLAKLPVDKRSVVTEMNQDVV